MGENSIIAYQVMREVDGVRAERIELIPIPGVNGLYVDKKNDAYVDEMDIGAKENSIYYCRELDF